MHCEGNLQEGLVSNMGMKKYLAKRAITMFGVLMATILITIALVGSNMDAILKQSVSFDIRQQVTINKN